jgi:hypothetical protein
VAWVGTGDTLYMALRQAASKQGARSQAARSLFEFVRAIRLSGALPARSSWKAAAMRAKPIDPMGAAAARAPREGSKPRPGGGPSAEDDPFDLWLRRQLHRCYAAIAAEPTPEELLRLIEEDGEP